MSQATESLIKSGTKLWLDSIDPQMVQSNFQMGATGATSNPIIIADLIKTGRYDDQIDRLIESDLDVNAIAWEMTDSMVSQTEQVFRSVWQTTRGNDGYVSFELDPLIEDDTTGLSHEQRVERYIELAKKWSAGHDNRMIKIPATPAGIGALEEIVAAGVRVNVTLIFTDRQYIAARDAVWAGAQRRSDLGDFKSVFSIFISRIDVYTDKHCPELAPSLQGNVGIINAQRIWALNQQFWSDKNCPLDQEIIFASTGTKKPEDPPHKYVIALAGGDIQTNPPATNDAVASSQLTFSRTVDKLPADEIVAQMLATVDFEHLEGTLMSEGLVKFAQPQKDLLALIRSKQPEKSANSG